MGGLATGNRDSSFHSFRRDRDYSFFILEIDHLLFYSSPSFLAVYETDFFRKHSRYRPESLLRGDIKFCNVLMSWHYLKK